MKILISPKNSYVTRITALLLAILICLVGCKREGESCTQDSVTPPSQTDEAPSYKVAYVPLDNRPVNKERVIYLAQSANVELLMPDEVLYRTALDDMPPNKDGSTLGNRQRLLEWLKLADKECDHFIISLDQMTSGGLVGSRWLCNEDLTLEYSIIDAVLKLGESNTVYLFDTVMRLASTVGYHGYGLEEYTATRTYGEQARKELADDALTVDNIIDAYPYGQNGELIVSELSASELDRYHAARARKLRLADYVLRRMEGKIGFFYIGVDDSSPKSTIQTNEINYINSLRGENSTLGSATDEIAMCCLARMINELYGINVAVNVTFFGSGQNKPADSFDVGSLAESVSSHLEALWADKAKNSDNFLDVLCLTRESSDNEREALIERLKHDQNKKIPTVLIDVSGTPELLAKMLIADSSVDLCRIFGYSSWNTASNAIGIALSQGVSRYGYLQSVARSSQYAANGFLRSLTFSFIKDISYKCFHPDLDGFMTDVYPCSADDVLSRINSGRVITSLNGYKTDPHAEISISDLRYPWNRTFEATFDIKIKKG